MAARRKAPAKKRASASSASGKKPFKISHPGALKRAKKKGESTTAAAERFKRSGTPAQKKRADFYLNVLKPATAKRKKSSAATKPRGTAKRKKRGY